MSDTIAVIGAPSSAGAYAPGQERAPAVFRQHGLVQAIGQSGRHVHDRGDVEAFRWRPDFARPTAMNLEAVRNTAQAVASRVADALTAAERVLVLGGDCTVELGVVAGSLRGGTSVGVVYIDGDADLNVPATAEGALDWTGVAHLLDLPGALPELTSLGPQPPLLSAKDVLLLGAHEVTPAEQRTIEEKRIEHVTLSAVQSDPGQAARHAREWAAPFDRLLVHLDIDVLAFTAFPIAANVRYGARQTGLALAELSTILDVLLAAPNWTALTIAEVMPEHAPNEAETFRRLIEMLVRALRGLP
jgi:arginase